jgi:hypothetical protein
MNKKSTDETHLTAQPDLVSNSASESVYAVNKPPKREKKHTALRSFMLAVIFVIGIVSGFLLHRAIDNSADGHNDAEQNQNDGAYVGDAADDSAAEDAESTQAEQQPDVDESIKMVLNNQPYEPTEPDGAVLRPIRYNDQLYMPILAFADAFKQAVEYDSISKTVYIGEKEWTPVTPEMSVYTPSASIFTYSEDQKKLTIGLHHFEYGLVVEQVRYTGARQELVLDGKFQKITFKAIAEDTIDGIMIRVRDSSIGGEVFLDTNVTDQEQEVELDIKGVEKLTVQAYKSSPSGGNVDMRVVLGEMKFK